MEIDAEEHLKHSKTLRKKGRFIEALHHCNRAIKLAPGFEKAYVEASDVLLKMGFIDKVLDFLKQAVILNPGSSVAHLKLGHAHVIIGQIDNAIACYRRAAKLELGESGTTAHSRLLHMMYYHPGFDERAILAEAKLFAAKQGEWRFAVNRCYARNSETRRLRVGYVSPNFRDHVNSCFTIPLLLNHDRGKFEIFCYAELEKPDKISERHASYADAWRNTHLVGDLQLAKMVEDDGIDVLVDLNMHAFKARPKLFAQKPAPVQVSWLSYPGTTGIPGIDYRLTDPWLDPPELGDHRYAEKSIRLPDTFWCFDPLTSDFQPNDLPALKTGHITFGCLNNFTKVSDDSLSRWGEIMAKLPGSRLILHVRSPGHTRQRVLDILGRFGITTTRIDLIEKRPRAEYLQIYHSVDLCLDPLPFNGGATSIDACWMGVPVVTQVGRTVVGRMGWSILNNLGLPELAAFDDRAYIATASALANDLPRLSHLRSTLRGRMEASPLMDGKRFAEAMEAVYRQIYLEKISDGK